jgi:N-glycosylase/DNA lyase
MLSFARCLPLSGLIPQSRMSTVIRDRPPFPSGWSSLAITPSNLTLANTLPIGQSFLWHRHQLYPETRLQDHPAAGPSTLPKEEPNVTLPEQPIEEFSRALLDPPRVVCLRQTSSHIYYTTLHPEPSHDDDDLKQRRTERWLRDYFHLDKYPSLETLYAEWRDRDPGMFGRLDIAHSDMVLGVGGRARGVRLLRQDPWECLIAYVVARV